MMFKKNRFHILYIIIIFLIIGLSFYEYYDHNFSYIDDYYKIKENCYEKRDLSYSYCDQLEGENLELYLEIFDPEVLSKRNDTITITSSIVEHSNYSVLQFLSPLLIMMAVIGTVHSELSTGMFKNYLMRMEYKDYLKKTYKVAFKTSLIIPLSLILIFIISSFVSGFNFNVVEETKGLAVYDSWKYNNFFIYASVILLIQFTISMFYANIALYCCKKNKNMLLAIITAYIFFFVANIFIYVFYGVVINKIFGFKELSDFFNIAGYWFFEDSSRSYIALIIAAILQLASTLILYKSFKNKEGVITEHEKQVA